MGSALDNWSPENKATCFRRFAQDLKEQSKQVFLRDKFHTELFFLVNEDGQGVVMQAPANIERDEMAGKLRQTIRENNIYGLVHVVETWTYFRQKPGDHTLKQIMDGEIKVSELRPDDRDEALVVMMETREGAHFAWMTPIFRDGDRPTLGETMSIADRLDERFADLFAMPVGEPRRSAAQLWATHGRCPESEYGLLMDPA